MVQNVTQNQTEIEIKINKNTKVEEIAELFSKYKEKLVNISIIVEKRGGVVIENQIEDVAVVGDDVIIIRLRRKKLELRRGIKEYTIVVVENAGNFYVIYGFPIISIKLR